MTDRCNFDTLCPEVHIRINGNDLPLAAKADLISVSVEESTEKASISRFTLVCWDGREMKVKWIDDDLFREGNELEVEMGYRGKLAKLFQGEITALEPDFPNGAQPTMTVQGLAKDHRLMRKTKTQTFLKMKDSDIANQIASKWGLKPEIVDSGVVIDYVMQNNRTDYEFLINRARRIGFEVFVKDRKLHFRPREYKGSAVLKLERDIALLSFRPRLSTMGQAENVHYTAQDIRTKGVINSCSGRGDEQPMADTSGPAAVQNAFGNTTTGSTSVSVPVQSQAEADQLSRSANKEAALRYVEGDGECIGQPDLRVGKLIEITGFGKRFSGVYYVTSASHSYSSGGYKTSFHVKRNAT